MMLMLDKNNEEIDVPEEHIEAALKDGLEPAFEMKNTKGEEVVVRKSHLPQAQKDGLEFAVVYNAKQKPISGTTAADAVGHGFAEGVTLGWDDEISGGVKGAYQTLTKGGKLEDNYKRERDTVRQAKAAVAKEHPGKYMLANIGGALTIPNPTGWARAGAAGVIAGAGLSEDEDFTKDALIGGAVGGVMDRVGQGVKWGAKKLGGVIADVKPQVAQEYLDTNDFRKANQVINPGDGYKQIARDSQKILEQLDSKTSEYASQAYSTIENNQTVLPPEKAKLIYKKIIGDRIEELERVNLTKESQKAINDLKLLQKKLEQKYSAGGMLQGSELKDYITQFDKFANKRAMRPKELNFNEEELANYRGFLNGVVKDLDPDFAAIQNKNAELTSELTGGLNRSFKNDRAALNTAKRGRGVIEAERIVKLEQAAQDHLNLSPNLFQRVQQTDLEKYFSGPITNGSKGVNLMGGLGGAALGGISGVMGGPQDSGAGWYGAALGGLAGAGRDQYARTVAKKILDGYANNPKIISALNRVYERLGIDGLMMYDQLLKKQEGN